MRDLRAIRSAPEIPDEGQPFILRRTALLWFLLLQPVVWAAILSIFFNPALNPGGVPWPLLAILSPFVAVAFLGVVRLVGRVAGIWLAADPDGVWVRARSRRRADTLAVWVPWSNIESVFSLQANRVGLPSGGWSIVVRVRDLPLTLRPPEGRESDRATFVTSTWLSNYRAKEAIAALARLAEGRAPVG